MKYALIGLVTFLLAGCFGSDPIKDYELNDIERAQVNVTVNAWAWQGLPYNETYCDPFLENLHILVADQATLAQDGYCYQEVNACLGFSNGHYTIMINEKVLGTKSFCSLILHETIHLMERCSQYLDGGFDYFHSTPEIWGSEDSVRSAAVNLGCRGWDWLDGSRYGS